MGRKTVYNDGLTSEQDWTVVNEENKRLLKEFIRYCTANDKSPKTCAQYEAQLKIFFCWNLKENKNKFFVDIKKRDLVSFFGWGRELGWSSCRLASFRAVLSSFSNFIERILDEDYPTFRNIVKVLEPIHVENVREKTVVQEDEIISGMEKLVERGEYQLACFLALLASSGMRKSEAAQMKLEYFTDKKEIVFRGLAYITPKIRTKGHGVKGKQISRYVFKENFDKYLNLWIKQREILNIKNEELFVVKGKTGYKAASSSIFTSWCEKIGKIIGVENLYAHSLRHYFATSLKKKGFPDSVVISIIQWNKGSGGAMLSIYDDRSSGEELDGFFANLKANASPVKNEFLEE